MAREWSDAELMILRDGYGRSGLRKRLPGRTPDAIRGMASKMGFADKRKPWTILEESMLRCGILPPGRDWYAAWEHSKKLARQGPAHSGHLWGLWHGETEEQTGKWTDEETAMLANRRVPPGRTWQKAAMKVHYQRNVRGDR